jgi:hypothetical protein
MHFESLAQRSGYEISTGARYPTNVPIWIVRMYQPCWVASAGGRRYRAGWGNPTDLNGTARRRTVEHPMKQERNSSDFAVKKPAREFRR